MNKLDVKNGVGEEGEILEKDLIFLANHSKQGPRICIYVPKQYHERIIRLKNPLKVSVESAAW